MKYLIGKFISKIEANIGNPRFLLYYRVCTIAVDNNQQLYLALIATQLSDRQFSI